jgi:hypothetical protein
MLLTQKSDPPDVKILLIRETNETRLTTGRFSVPNDGQFDNESLSDIALSPLARMAIVFSALIHDVNHPGVSNAQVVSVRIIFPPLKNRVKRLTSFDKIHVWERSRLGTTASDSKQSQLNKEDNATMTERKRADFSSSTGNPNKKGGGERLIDSSRNCIVVGDTFVSGEGNISADLVDKVSKKACEFYMTFMDPRSIVKHYCGQGGLIRGKMLASTRPDDDVQPKRRKVDFQEDPHYEATPLTAKHNLTSQGTETYLQTLVRWFDKVETYIVLPDGGCKMTERIQDRPATATKNEIAWNADDISFGDKITDPSKLTEASRLFEKIPNDFKVCVGHRIGALVRGNAGTRPFRFGEGRVALFDGMKIGNGRLAKLHSRQRKR